ncbi:MAG: C25 family cysteine peptidase, partial [Chitinivibrionales bacterium]|nr:C25 family cysteine peptidase [Chitinivibrionales bacterium]
DGYFSLIDGSDNFPDIAVGRFPAENRAQMQIMVDKTLRYYTKAQSGYWRDNLILAGGVEPAFTTFNDMTANEAIGPNMNILRMDADPASIYYKNEFNASRTMANYINAGAYAINFNGHGGGNIWSDSRFFSYTDLDNLYNGYWGAGGKLPLVFSFTCLTGFFESALYKSLGVEFLRHSANGAIGFFGASGYTSLQGNFNFNRIFLEHAMHDSTESVGTLILNAKMDMLVSFAPQSIPLVRQYNFLGDPALPWRLAPRNLTLTVDSAVVRSGDSLRASGRSPAVSQGTARVELIANNSPWQQKLAPVLSDTFSARFALKDSLPPLEGLIRAYAWNDSADGRGWTRFAHNQIAIDSLNCVPNTFGMGDSIEVSCKPIIPAGDSQMQLLCLYALCNAYANPVSMTGVRMQRDSAGRYTTMNKLVLTTGNSPAASDQALTLFVQFRNTAAAGNRQSQRYAFTVAPRPDLRFVNDSAEVVFLNDSLAAAFDILNAGNGACGPFELLLRRRFSDAAPFDTLARLTIRDSLPPGKTRHIVVMLADTMGAITLYAVLNPDRSFPEISYDNNSTWAHSTVQLGDLAGSGDTLRSVLGGCAVVPLHPLLQRERVFLFTNALAANAPLPTSSRWIKLRGDTGASFAIMCRPPLAASDTLQWIFYPDTAKDSLFRQAKMRVDSGARGKIALFTRNERYNRYGFAQDYSSSTKNGIIFMSGASGPFAPGFCRDITGPSIALSVEGRDITFLDYAAKNKPFNVRINDPSGVPPSSVQLALNGRSLDSAVISAPATNDALTSLVLNASLAKEHATDSLVVSAADFAGNFTRATFAYMPGEDLSIKFFACYPNPFSAPQDNSGRVLQYVRFAYLLTDQADQVTISIYTITARKIKTFNCPLIGYQEVQWDGHTDNGFRLANGTYYAKLIAKKGKKTLTKIIKIAKLEGF